ncbi:serine hydrolase [Spongiactinospora rosea]|uniref:Serine hydrolase n=1 Tax=Spongiactinospora rosea TaxID=2248750 RepID=A0A366LR59_9ACTN|nr:serine hydrolase [Spongiactinospora rosea]RBQ16100.1 serine hydrolase [Spongiactinospora rosea]
MAYAWQTRHVQTAADYQTLVDTLRPQNYRPLDVNGYSINGVPHFASIWEQSPGPDWLLRHDLTSDQHSALFQTLPGQGYRPIAVSPYDKGGTARFASLWYKDAGYAFDARHGILPADFQAVFDQLKAQGYRPVDFCAYTDGGQLRFSAIWDKSPMPEWAVRHGMTPGTFTAERAHWEAHGFVLWRVSGYLDGGTRYAAIWIKGAPEVTWQARQGLSSAEYQAQFDALRARGFRPAKINGYGTGAATQYAGIWHKPYLSADEETFIGNTMATFMTAHGVPGASVAVTNRGRLVFARGFGVTDPATNVPVTASHLFRIASVAKPITAVTVFRLIERGLLALGDRVFGAGGRLGTTFGRQPYAPNIDRITVQHLLEHTAGWARSQDPMFSRYTLTQRELIDWMLGHDGRTPPTFNAPLTHTPGTTFEYLNFGYCLLGRVIERVTGLTYAEAVRQNVLVPCGITDMHIAGDTLADRRANEVVYTPRGSTLSPYGIRISRMDSHGGWIASPADLMRFLVRVDGFASKQDILTAASIATMSTPTTAVDVGGGTVDYAKGWHIHSSGNRWHDGDVPGTAAMFVRTADQIGWAVLVNSRNDSNLDGMRADIDQLRRTVTQRITDWPATDLF